MPTLLSDGVSLQVGDYYEDCAFLLCLCIRIDVAEDELLGLSLVDSSFPRSCSPRHCGVRKLTLAEALHWKFFGPLDEHTIPEDKQWWQAHDIPPWIEAFRLPSARA